MRGLFEAYARGRAHFQLHHRTEERDARIPCAWFDEFGTARADATAEDFGTSHDAFVARRVLELGKLACSGLGSAEGDPLRDHDGDPRDHDGDPGDHDGDPGDHDAAIWVITMRRSG